MRFLNGCLDRNDAAVSFMSLEDMHVNVVRILSRKQRPSPYAGRCVCFHLVFVCSWRGLVLVSVQR